MFLNPGLYFLSQIFIKNIDCILLKVAFNEWYSCLRTRGSFQCNSLTVIVV